MHLGEHAHPRAGARAQVRTAVVAGVWTIVQWTNPALGLWLRGMSATDERRPSGPQAADPPDPAGQPVDDIRDEFIETLYDCRGEDNDAGERLAERARKTLGRRPLADDALAFTLALIDWARLDVLPAINPATAELPSVGAYTDVEPLAHALASFAWDAKQAWLASPDREDPTLWNTYWLNERIYEAAQDLLSIPKYRHHDPKWKAKKPRPTPMSLCAHAASKIAQAFLTAMEVEADLVGALDRIGLGDELSRSRAIRARKALQAVGVPSPGADLLALTETLAAACDAAPHADARTLSARALASADATAVGIVADTPALAVRPVPTSGPTTVAETATLAIEQLAQELLPALAAGVPARSPVTRKSMEETPAEPLPYRATPGELAARIERGVRQGRRKKLATALRDLSKLGDEVSEQARRGVAEAILDMLRDDVHGHWGWYSRSACQQLVAAERDAGRRD